MRETRKEIAKETLRILESSRYTSMSGRVVMIDEYMQKMMNGTRLYTSESLESLAESIREKSSFERGGECRVVNETTLKAASRLVESGQYKKVGVLNFASAKNPGGGFLSGSQAQEESLTRSSALYQSLVCCQDGYYEYHRRLASLLYSDRMIYTPGCPVFRHDNGALLEKPYLIDVVTSPAPNLGAMRRDDPDIREVPLVLAKRSEKILALFAQEQCEAIVLGAWGCGVFRNDPKVVASTFAEHLRKGRTWSKHFKRIEFAVLDRTPGLENIKVFEQVMGG